MPLTPFGKAIRKLRIDKDMLLKDLADVLGVTPTFLSAVEAGRKAVPPGWPDRIAVALGLDGSERRGLADAAAMSAREVRIPIPSTASDLDRSVAAILARSFGDLDEDQMREIRAILDRGKA